MSCQGSVRAASSAPRKLALSQFKNHTDVLPVSNKMNILNEYFIHNSVNIKGIYKFLIYVLILARFAIFYAAM